MSDRLPKQTAAGHAGLYLDQHAAPVNNARRRFLQRTGMSMAALAVTACGGGSGVAVAGASGNPTSAPSAPTQPVPPASPAPVSDPDTPVQAGPALSAAFLLLSATGGSHLPFAIGHPFRQGQVPPGHTVIGTLPDLQFSAKNHWPDGSLKFAILAGHATLAAGQPLKVELSLGRGPAVTALSTTQLKATGITAAVGCGTFGTAAWADADWDAPFQTWMSGAQMSSWIYRKPVGGDAHLVAWLEVRLFASGAVEVLPWIENGYLLKPGVTNKNATYTFTLGGTQRFSAAFDLPHHCRTPLVTGAALTHWLGKDPGVTSAHDPVYFQSTGLVPRYYNVVPTGSVWNEQVQTYAPLQLGNHSAGMGGAGYDRSIGLIPEWDVLYVTTQDPRAYKSMIVNAYGHGRYGIHYRDETTNKPINFASHPNLVIGDGAATGISDMGTSATGNYTPVATGTRPPAYAMSHHHSFGHVAYLATGRFYFMEEVQFAATLNYLTINSADGFRNGSRGIIRSNQRQVRGAAWGLRTLAQAACVTPDDDSLHAQFVNSLASNIDFYHTRYVANPNNRYGLIKDYGEYEGQTATTADGQLWGAPWQQDFFTAAIGYALSMDLPLPAATRTKFKEFFAWKAQSVVGRCGPTNDTSAWTYRDAAVYHMVFAPSETPEFTGEAVQPTGPWYGSWGQMYDISMGGVSNNRTVDRSDGPLRSMGSGAGQGAWGNLMPAIAYAVAHGVTGASAAYARLTQASNWSTMLSSLETYPVWSVRP